jgi:3-hydroxybutyryl-CoA dehydrogenase
MSSIKKIGIVGAGQMGAGIAQVCAHYGYTTLLSDSSEAALTKGHEGIVKRIQRLVEKEAISDSESRQILGRLSACAIKDLGDCDLVIEAIVENFDVKAALFRELDSVVKPGAILASNTSSISITRIAETTKRPELVMGVHFMNPVPVMELVELIRGLQTSDTTYSTITEFCHSIKKTNVLAIDGPGFIVNRILCPMINEAIFLLQEGCKPEDIDTSMKLGTNHPMGPLELADFVGLDTLLFILQILHRELGEDKYRPCPLLRRYVEAGWYGKKTGRGFYRY